MAKGYTTAALVEAEMGVTLTAAQTTAATDLVGEAESLIDRYTARAWIVASPATDTLVVPADGVLGLSQRPVTAITSVSVRPATIGAASTALVAADTYELLDAADGQVLVSTVYRGYLATVAYTHTNTAAALPLGIQRAATLLVAAWLLPRLNPDRAGLDSYEVGGELKVKISTEKSLPPDVLRILDAYAAVVLA